MNNKYDFDFIKTSEDKLSNIEQAELYSFIKPIIESDYWQQKNKKAISSLLVAFLFSVLLWFCFFHFNFLYLAEEV